MSDAGETTAQDLLELMIKAVDRIPNQPPPKLFMSRETAEEIKKAYNLKEDPDSWVIYE